MAFTDNAIKVFRERLCKPDESPEEALARVASAIYPDNMHKQLRLFDSMASRDFFPNSPAIRATGDPESPGGILACYVLHVPDSIRGIYTTMMIAALVHKEGGGTGFCFSDVRPEGWEVQSTKGIASGPLSFLKTFNQSTETIKQGSQRRGANMATFSVYHPDIVQFINMKRDLSQMQNFNVSVLLDDRFMGAVEMDASICLTFPVQPSIYGEPTCFELHPHTHENAQDILQLIAECAHGNGEPGIIFIDAANRTHAHPELGTLSASNPCGEQIMLPNEACVLGSINLSNYVVNGCIDYIRLQRDIPLYVETLDRMIDISKYPVPEIEQATKRTRRIGLGVMGWADMLMKLSIKYDSDEALALAEILGSFLRAHAESASQSLAHELGAYPAYFKGNPNQPQFRRNSAVTTVAPTGTLSMLADCSSGIEPAFALSYTRQHRLEQDPNELTVMQDMNPVYREWLINHQDASVIPEHFVTAQEIAPPDHIRMQAAWQKHFAHNAISKTINAPQSHTVEEVLESIKLAHRLGVKGFTYYRDSSRQNQVLTPNSDCGGVACSIEERIAA